MIHRFRKIGTAASIPASSNAGSMSNLENKGESSDVQHATPSGSLTSIKALRRQSLAVELSSEKLDDAHPPLLPLTTTASHATSKWGRILGVPKPAATEDKDNEPPEPPKIAGDALTQINPPSLSRRSTLSAGLRASRFLKSEVITEEDEIQTKRDDDQNKTVAILDDNKVVAVLDALKDIKRDLVDELQTVSRRIDLIDDHLLQIYEIVGKCNMYNGQNFGQRRESDEAESVSSILKLFRKGTGGGGGGGTVSPKECRKARDFNPDVEMHSLGSDTMRYRQLVSKRPVCDNKRSGSGFGGLRRSYKTSKVSPTTIESTMLEIDPKEDTWIVQAPSGRIVTPVFHDHCSMSSKPETAYLQPLDREKVPQRKKAKSPNSRRTVRAPFAAQYDACLGSGDGLSSISTLGDDIDDTVSFQKSSNLPLIQISKVEPLGNASLKMSVDPHVHFPPRSMPLVSTQQQIKPLQSTDQVKRNTVVRTSNTSSTSEFGHVSLL